MAAERASWNANRSGDALSPHPRCRSSSQPLSRRPKGRWGIGEGSPGRVRARGPFAPAARSSCISRARRSQGRHVTEARKPACLSRSGTRARYRAPHREPPRHPSPASSRHGNARNRDISAPQKQRAAPKGGSRVGQIGMPDQNLIMAPTLRTCRFSSALDLAIVPWPAPAF